MAVATTRKSLDCGAIRLPVPRPATACGCTSAGVGKRTSAERNPRTECNPGPGSTQSTVLGRPAMVRTHVGWVEPTSRNALSDGGLHPPYEETRLGGCTRPAARSVPCV